MPKRLDIHEGGSIEIRGVTVVVALARGKRATLGIAVEDGDGLLESPEDCKRWAGRLRAIVDKPREIGDY